MFTKYLERFCAGLRQSYSGLRGSSMALSYFCQPAVRCRKHSLLYFFFCGWCEEGTVALCLCHTAKSPFNFISHCSAVIALPTEIRRPEEVGEDASAKEIKSCFTKIALLFSCVFCGLGALGLFPNTAHTSVQVQQGLWGPGESPCRGAGMAKAGKLN